MYEENVLLARVRSARVTLTMNYPFITNSKKTQTEHRKVIEFVDQQ